MRDVDQLVYRNTGYFEKVIPRKIVLKRSLTFEKHAKGPFGSYFETNEDSVIINSNPGILLGPTRNIQGNQIVLDIKSGVIKNVAQFVTYLCPKKLLILCTIGKSAQRASNTNII